VLWGGWLNLSWATSEAEEGRVMELCPSHFDTRHKLHLRRRQATPSEARAGLQEVHATPAPESSNEPAVSHRLFRRRSGSFAGGRSGI
jgi:hypothetical protein